MPVDLNSVCGAVGPLGAEKLLDKSWAGAIWEAKSPEVSVSAFNGHVFCLRGTGYTWLRVGHLATSWRLRLGLDMPANHRGQG